MLRISQVPALQILQDVNFLAGESVRRGRQFITSTERVSQRVINQLNLSTFIAMDPFEEVLRNSIRFDLVQRSKRHIRIGAVRWDTGYIEYFSNQDLTVDVGPKIVQASSAVPFIFPRVEVNGMEYADGGLIENSPLQGAIEAKADVIHVVSSFPQVANIPKDISINSLDTIYRMLVINVTKSLRRDIERYRNVNDVLLVLEKMRLSGQEGESYQLLKQVVDRIRRQENPDYRRVTIHVHMPAEPMATILRYVDFGREYLQSLIRQGYFDAVSHNCKLNGCVIPVEEHVDEKPTQPASVYGDSNRATLVDPGITF